MADSEPDFSRDGMTRCEYCDGWFFREDMDGDHCNACAEDLFEQGV